METFKSFANELTLIANDFANAYITVGMFRNFAFIRENALTNNRIGASERVRSDEKVPRGNKLTMYTQCRHYGQNQSKTIVHSSVKLSHARRATRYSHRFALKP